MLVGIVSHTTCRIENNIVRNGIGANEGAGGGTNSFRHMVYIWMITVINVVINGNTCCQLWWQRDLSPPMQANITINEQYNFPIKNEEIR